LTDSGAIYTGALVENLVFGLAMCAERVALFSSVTAGGERPAPLAVASPQTAGRRTFPCGSCLQVAIELGERELPVLAVDPSDGSYETRTVGGLAPGIPHRRPRR
jgi:cytidine deaminase